MDVHSQVDVTYKTAFTSPLTSGGKTAHRGVVLSGFENYLHYQIKINVTILTVYADRITLDVYVGATTYIKQLNINYFVMVPEFALNPLTPLILVGKHNSIQISIGSKILNLNQIT